MRIKLKTVLRHICLEVYMFDIKQLLMYCLVFTLGRFYQMYIDYSDRK